MNKAFHHQNMWCLSTLLAYHIFKNISDDCAICLILRAINFGPKGNKVVPPIVSMTKLGVVVVMFGKRTRACSWYAVTNAL